MNVTIKNMNDMSCRYEESEKDTSGNSFTSGYLSDYAEGCKPISCLLHT